MYIFVWIDGSIRTVNDNLTVGDMMGVLHGTVNVLRVRSSSVERLTPDEGKLYWVPVKESSSVASTEVKFHIP
jgi:hypothetical protein